MDKKRVAQDLLYGYGLTGERREASLRNWKRYVVLQIVLVILVLIFAIIGMISGKVATTTWVAYGICVASIFIVTVVSLRKKDTGWQLWFRQRKALKEERQKNLDELLAYAEKVKRGQVK